MLFLRIQLNKLKNEIINGWYQIPYLYLSVGVMTLGGIITGYRWLTLPAWEDRFTRHKNQYIVVRPNDPRLNKYPSNYITESHLLEKYRQQQTK